ncbi:hypothetical protein EI555_009043, partial [Monodon monoceros]
MLTSSFSFFVHSALMAQTRTYSSLWFGTNSKLKPILDKCLFILDSLAHEPRKQILHRANLETKAILGMGPDGKLTSAIEDRTLYKSKQTEQSRTKPVPVKAEVQTLWMFLSMPFDLFLSTVANLHHAKRLSVNGKWKLKETEKFAMIWIMDFFVEYSKQTTTIAEAEFVTKTETHNGVMSKEFLKIRVAPCLLYRTNHQVFHRDSPEENVLQEMTKEQTQKTFSKIDSQQLSDICLAMQGFQFVQRNPSMEIKAHVGNRGTCSIISYGIVVAVKLGHHYNQILSKIKFFHEIQKMCSETGFWNPKTLTKMKELDIINAQEALEILHEQRSKEAENQSSATRLTMSAGTRGQVVETRGGFFWLHSLANRLIWSRKNHGEHDFGGILGLPGYPKSYGTSLGMGYCTCGILCVPENKLHLAKTDGETLSALKINKVVVQCVQVLAKDWCISLNGFMRNGEYLLCLHFDYLLAGDIINLSLLKKINAGHLDSFCSDVGRFVLEQGDWLTEGDLQVFDQIYSNDDLDQYCFTPTELKQVPQWTCSINTRYSKATSRKRLIGALSFSFTLLNTDGRRNQLLYCWVRLCWHVSSRKQGRVFMSQLITAEITMALGLITLEIVSLQVTVYNKKKKCVDYHDSEHHEDFEFISGTQMCRLAQQGQKHPEVKCTGKKEINHKELGEKVLAMLMRQDGLPDTEFNPNMFLQAVKVSAVHYENMTLHMGQRQDLLPYQKTEQDSVEHYLYIVQPCLRHPYPSQDEQENLETNFSKTI